MRTFSRLLLPIVLLPAFATAPGIAAVCDGISPVTSNPMTTVRVASGLSRPLFVTAPAGDVDRVFILEQDGRIRILRDGSVLPTAFLDINTITRSPADLGGGDEEGLLGLAFHPNYATNGWIFIYHTDNTGANNIVARYTRSATDPNRIDTTTRLVVISFAHPTNTNHNGGMMAFAPDDGFLYIGTGDGGGGCDFNNNAQTLTSNLGKLLRLNVNSLPYQNPPDNPFVGVSGNDEIWSYGLRNPWRWSFDRVTSDLYIADVGQGKWEELNWRAGTATGRENYGWKPYEANQCPNPSCPNAGSCSIANNTPPVYWYDQQAPGLCSITGGYAYRGCRMPDLEPTYFYADYCAATISTLKINAGVPTTPIDRTSELAPGGGLAINSITSFGEDARGELFVVDRGGEVFKIVPVLTSMEVSGEGAAPFQLGDAEWTWEDLESTSSHPIVEYRVYRSNGNGSGIFDCIHKTTLTSWTGGDLLTPGTGSVFAYLVVGRNAAGAQTSPGTGTTGQPRQLSPAPCP